MTQPFLDRRQAGSLLARCLHTYAGRADVVVLALPRGGVPVAFEVAHALRAPLGVFLVRKLGVPGHEELAMGALAVGWDPWIDRSTVRAYHVGADALRSVIQREQIEITHRYQLYLQHTVLEVAGSTVILVDDGLATGATMRAAVIALRARAPARIVVAVPIAATDICAALGREVDDIACALAVDDLYSVGRWYADFSQTSDDEAQELLERAARELGELISSAETSAQRS